MVNCRSLKQPSVTSYNVWLRSQNRLLSSTLKISMEKLQAVLLALQSRSDLETILVQSATSRVLEKVEDLTSTLRHLDTMEAKL